MIERRNDFAPFIAAFVAAGAVWVGWRVWLRLAGRNKFLQGAAAIGATIGIAAAAMAIKDLIPH